MDFIPGKYKSTLRYHTIIDGISCGEKLLLVPRCPFFAARDWSFVHLELKHKLYRERVGIPPDGPVDYPGFGIAFLQSYTFFELMEKKVYPVKSLSGY